MKRYVFLVGDIEHDWEKVILYIDGSQVTASTCKGVMEVTIKSEIQDGAYPFLAMLAILSRLQSTIDLEGIKLLSETDLDPNDGAGSGSERAKIDLNDQVYTKTPGSQEKSKFEGRALDPNDGAGFEGGK